MSVLRRLAPALLARPAVARLSARGFAAATPRVRADDALTKPEEPAALQAYTVSGAPPGLRRRGVRIFSPAKTAMQSGQAKKGEWVIDFDVQDKWENPLMGWVSSADPVQALKVSFASKEDAIAFAERQGWDYWIDLPKEVRFRKKSYSDNFLYVPGKLRLYKTK
ncbi:Ndufs4, NADH dehydrogenase Fe-S protein 4 [Hyaloraphidium curvatum]|nr:Ndufs4, NADH dehydrogenase Fe-S protein 4 [Hyaloraphidium curvatum]